jgi:hypothetical protein
MAVSKATVAGDSIFVRSGTYTVNATVIISKSGTAAKPIVLTVYMPDMVNANSRPLFDFSGMAVNSSNRGFKLSGYHLKVYGIIIKGAGDNGMNLDGASFCTIEFCDFTRNRDAGIQLGGGASADTLINCDSYENADLGTGTTTMGGNADGFSPKLDVGDSIYLRGCRSWLNSDDGYDGYLRPTTGVHWTLEDCWSFRNGYYWLNGSTTAEENGMGFKTGGSDNKNLAHNCTLIRCLSFDNKGHGFDQNSNAGTIAIYNCSAYSNVENDFYMTSPTVTYAAGAQLILENNLSLGSQGVSIPANTTAWPVTTATNSFSKNTTSAEILSFDTTGITGMRGVDGSLPVLNFMHLNPSAPTPYTYIDKGTVLSTVVYHGVMGIPYNGAAPDLGAFETDAIVPVRMVSFTAFSNTNGVTLNWEMALEINNKGWSVERADAANSASWTDVGFVNGAGNSSLITTYSYLDKNVFPGTYYYRLKQVDLSGLVTYSNIILVKIETGKPIIQVAAYPNPFRSSATVRYNVPANAKVSLTVYNGEGQLINTLIEEQQQAGTYQKLINGQFLSNGKYYLKLTVGSQSVTSPIVRE